MRVRLLELVDGKQRVMATLTLRDGRAVLTGRTPPRITQQLAELSHQAKTPEAFLRRLPREFNGTYLRAELVES